MAMRFLDVPFHQQDNISSCGEAAAQMILASIGLGVFNQADLGRVIPPTGKDGLSPAELRCILNKTRGTFPLTFVACYDRDAATGAQRIAEAIALHGIGVPAVIWANHWVVVTGVALAGAIPAQGPFDVRGFFINDPLPDTPTTALPQPQCQVVSLHHHASGDCCGSGRDFGSANSYVTLNGWLRHAWSAFYTDITGNEPSGFISVVGEPAPPAELVRTSIGALMPALVPPRDPPAKIGKTAAQLQAVQGILSHGLTCDGPLAKHLAGVSASSATESYNSFAGNHYRVALINAAGNLAGYAFVDMVTGEFFGVQAPASEDVPPAAFEAFVLAALEESKAELADIISPDALAQRAFAIHEKQVWEPCVQSMTPYAPFFAVELGTTVLYVDRDSRVHRTLKPHPPQPPPEPQFTSALV